MRLLLLIVASFCLFYAPANSQSLVGDLQPAKFSGQVRVAVWNPVRTLDPAYTTTTEKIMMMEALFQGLMKNVEGKIVPARAKSMDISEDGKRYTFKLRGDLFWSDGTPETAGDYVLAFRRLVDPALTGEPRPSYLLTSIKNVKKIMKGEAELDTLGVSAPDDKTVVFELEGPSSFFAQVLAYPGLVPVPSHLVKQYGEDWWKQPQWVSNGKYTLEELTENGDITIRKLPNVSLEDAPVDAPKLIYFKFMDSGEQAVQELMAGNLDIAHNIRVSDAKWLDEQIGFQRVEQLLPGTIYMVMNTTRKKLSDPRVRKALALAVNREDLARAVNATVAETFAPEWMLEHKKELLVRGYDGMDYHERQKQAMALLAEAGYSEGNPLELTIMTSRRRNFDRLSIAIRSMLASIGVKADINMVPLREHSPRLAAKDYDVSLGDWIADYDDAMTFYSILETGASKNHSAFSHKEFDHLLETALVTLDDEERQIIYASIENILRDQAPIIPLYYISYTSIARPMVQSVGDSRFPSVSVFNIRMAKQSN